MYQSINYINKVVPGININVAVKNITRFILVAVLLFQLSCENNPVEVYNLREKFLIGKVTDTNGNPLINVDIHYVFYLKNDSYLNDLPINDIPLKYTLTSPMRTAIKIFNPVGIYIMGSFSKLQPAGNYTFTQDLSNFTNGIYHFEVFGSGVRGSKLISQGTFIVLRRNIGELITRSPLVRTDNSGNFKLKYSSLYINKSYNILVGDEQKEIQIADSIKIFLLKNNYTSTLKSIKINPNKTLKMNFVLSKHK